jgi:hypothetical protein
VLVETVGLGQSEVLVDDCVDMLLLIVPPGGEGFSVGGGEGRDVIVGASEKETDAAPYFNDRVGVEAADEVSSQLILFRTLCA